MNRKISPIIAAVILATQIAATLGTGSPFAGIITATLLAVFLGPSQWEAATDDDNARTFAVAGAAVMLAFTGLFVAAIANLAANPITL